MKRLLGIITVVALSFINQGSYASGQKEVPKGKDTSILWVVDNSVSMRGSREIVEKSFGEFINVLQQGDISYEIAVTTVDVFSQGGTLIPTPDGRTIVKKSPTALVDLTDIWSCVTDSATSFWEQGLEASYLALTKSAASLLKKDTSLSIIYVSDEEDYSCQDHCFGVEPEHNPDWKAFPVSRYTDYFKSLKTDSNIDVSVYPIVGMQADANCTVPSLGQRYEAVRAEIGSGIAGSVCPNAIESSVLAVAHASAGN